MRAWRTLGAAAFGAALVCLAMAGAASAAVTWVGTPTTINDSGSVGNASPHFDAAMDAGGDSLGIGAQGNGSATGKTDVLSRPTGGSFASPVQLESATFSTCSASNPCAVPVNVGFDSSGNGYAFVTSFDGTSVPTGLLNHEWILAHGSTTWSGPTPITTTTTANEEPDQDSSAAAVNGAGLQVIAWSTSTQIRVAMRTAGAPWPASSSLVATTGHPGTVVKVVVDSGGDVAIAYTFTSSQLHSEVAFLPAGSSTWTSQDLFPANKAEFPDIGIDGGGNVTAVFTRQTGASSFAISYETRPFLTGTWTSNASPTNLNTIGSNEFSAHIAVDPSGAMAAVWTNHPASIDVPEVSARSSSTASFDPPTDPSSSTGDGNAVAISPMGTATALWTNISGALEGAQHPVSGSWTKFTAAGTAPTSVSSRSVKLAEDGQGNGIVVFQDSFSQKTLAIGLAMAGPDLSSATIPPTGTVGTPVAFSVSPTSTWGTVAGTNVDLGDGTAAFNGTSGTHTFTTAGTFTVTFASSDSFGNSSSRQLTIAIASAGGGTGGGTTTGGGTSTGGGGTSTGGGGTAVPAGATAKPPPKPALHSSISRKTRAAKFKFSDPGATGFVCSLVRFKRGHKKAPKPRYSSCRSPKLYKHLSGKYEFFVRGKNPAGQSVAATKTFVV